MMTHAAVNAAQHVTCATWRKMMSEPREDDDIAIDKDAECDDCGCFIFECVCNEPDRMYGDED